MALQVVSKDLQNVCLRYIEATSVSQSAFAAICYSSLASPSLLSGFVSQTFFPALASAHIEEKKKMCHLHPYILDSCQDT